MAKKTAAKTSKAKKASQKSPAKKGPAKKSAAAKPTRKLVAKKTTKKVAPKKSAPKKSLGRSTAAKKAPKSAAKNMGAKKPASTASARNAGSNGSAKGGAIGPNTFGIVEYRLYDLEDNLIDSSEMSEPIEYVHGYGMLVPGLEAALVGMVPGGKKKVALKPEVAYGERDEEVVFSIDRKQLGQANVQVGDEIVFQESESGEEIDLCVVDVSADRVVLDANHPLAGQTIVYELDVVSTRPATPAELKAAAESFEEARDAHDEAQSEHLVTLKKRN